MNLRALNLGCGERFNPEWTNLDLARTGTNVQAHDLKQGIPFPDATFDVVYHSHVLEHFDRRAALDLLVECNRVLRSGGIIRVVVPDLEQIARLYLQALENAVSGGDAARAQYDWMLLELYDQTVRERSGGTMLEFARKGSAEHREFMRQRLGGEVDRMLKANPGDQGSIQAKQPISFRGVVGRLRRFALRLVAGPEIMKSYELGRFRGSGEVHHWMYDRYSLGRTLEQAGFRSPRSLGAAESSIPEWAGFHLDTEPDGLSYKPDSLYMEADRP
jgi:SAM-dependent methyltransferase